jgi:hypothetical protein
VKHWWVYLLLLFPAAVAAVSVTSLAIVFILYSNGSLAADLVRWVVFLPLEICRMYEVGKDSIADCELTGLLYWTAIFYGCSLVVWRSVARRKNQEKTAL